MNIKVGDIVTGRSAAGTPITGIVEEVDPTCYNPDDSPENPWIVIKVIHPDYVQGRSMGTLNALSQNWDLIKAD